MAIKRKSSPLKLTIDKSSRTRNASIWMENISAFVVVVLFFRLILKQQFLNSVVWRFHVTRRDAMLERRSQNHTVRSWVEMNRSSNQSPIIIIVVVVEEHKPIVKLLQKSFLVLADKTKCVTRVWQLFVFYFTSLFFYVFCLQKWRDVSNNLFSFTQRRNGTAVSSLLCRQRPCIDWLAWRANHLARFCGTLVPMWDEGGG